MPYSRDQVVAEITSFYEFLISMYLPEDALKRPPPGGWPHITTEQLQFLGKNETVVDLLKHLPYLKREHFDDEALEIYPFMHCNDYAGRYFIRTGIGNKRKHATEPFLGVVGDGIVADGISGGELNEEGLAMPGAHVATLGGPRVGDQGYHLFLNTDTGCLYMADETGEEREYLDISCFTETIKGEFKTLQVIPEHPTRVQSCAPKTQPGDTALQSVYHKHGWPGTSFRKDECAKEVAKSTGYDQTFGSSRH